MVVEEIYPAGEWLVAEDGAGMSAAGREALRSHLQNTGTQAAVVVRGGRIAAEWYWDGAADRERSILAGTPYGLVRSAARAQPYSCSEELVPLSLPGTGSTNGGRVPLHR
jgi:hypothetical protein